MAETEIGAAAGVGVCCLVLLSWWRDYVGRRVAEQTENLEGARECVKRAHVKSLTSEMEAADDAPSFASLMMTTQKRNTRRPHCHDQLKKNPIEPFSC